MIGLSKKHFKEFADALKAVKPSPANGPIAYWGWYRAVKAVTNILETSNPEFDYHKFESACGVEDEET